MHLTSGRFTDRTAATTTTTVKVYGTVDSAVLTVNGVRVGVAQTSDDHIYRWPGVTLAPGANVVTVTGTRGGTTYTDSATWTLR